MKALIILPLVMASASALAETPLRSLVYYSAAARQTQPDFVADSARGKSFALRKWGVSQSLPSCATCHTEQPRSPGRHAITGKPIAALSPAASPKRLSDPAKVAKWFKRNCNEVLGRACTPAEKADFIKFIMEDQAS
jgi:mono/diheme cytochrome c family protein